MHFMQIMHQYTGGGASARSGPWLERRAGLSMMRTDVHLLGCQRRHRSENDHQRAEAVKHYLLGSRWTPFVLAGCAFPNRFSKLAIPISQAMPNAITTA